jgi:hypothetical protein
VNYNETFNFLNLNRMKNKLFSTIVLAFVLVSCNQKGKEDTTKSRNEQHESTVHHNDKKGQNQAAQVKEDAALYACEMHPEVQGTKEEKCSKCGMKLTEPVSKKSE